MDSHVTYIQTQGHKSLGPTYEGDSQQGFLAHKASGEIEIKRENKMKERERERENNRTSE
jgi:hypothetical protein